MLEPYQLRVIQEKQDLDKRMAALDAFICSRPFLDLHIDDRCLMVAQFTQMQSYSETLGKRIVRFQGTLQ